PALPLSRAFNPYAQSVANFRDHALLIYPRSKLPPEARPFPSISYGPEYGPGGWILNGFGPIGVRQIGACGNGTGKPEFVEDCKGGIATVTETDSVEKADAAPTTGVIDTPEKANDLQTDDHFCIY